MHYSLNQALSIELEWRIQRKMAYIIYIQGLSFNSVIMSHPADSPWIFPFELIFLMSSAQYLSRFLHFLSQLEPILLKTSGRLDNFGGFPPDKLDHVRRVDAEEDVQDLGQSGSRLDPFQSIVLLLCPERALHPSRPYPRQLFTDDIILLRHECRTPSLHERCLYPLLPFYLLLRYKFIITLSIYSLKTFRLFTTVPNYFT